MAIHDLTVKTTDGVGANKVPIPSTRTQGEYTRVFQEFLDIGALVAAGRTIEAGDVFQLIKLPANFVTVFGGAEVIKVFDGTTPTVDIDWAAGDDIIDGGDVTALGYLAAGSNGQTNIINTELASTFAHWLTAEDTIDVTLNAGASDVTEGILRVYVVGAHLRDHGGVHPQMAVRDQLA